MIIYQLVVKGTRKASGKVGTMFSQKVFTFYEKAEAYQDDFKKLSVIPRVDNDMKVFDPDKEISVRIVELELIGNIG